MEKFKTCVIYIQKSLKIAKQNFKYFLGKFTKLRIFFEVII